jgi:hypothetical protein
MYKQPKPILRQEAWLTLNSALVHHITTADIFQNCLNCMNWDLAGDKCKKYDAKPPAEIIVHSCPEYVDGMEIPF